jgi:hypothetical protein
LILNEVAEKHKAPDRSDLGASSVAFGVQLAS